MAIAKKPKLTAAEAERLARAFLGEIEAYGFAVNVAEGTIVGIRKRFTPGDMDAYVRADMNAYRLLDRIPSRGGSVWGTTSDGVGGHVGMKNGYYELKKSGVPKLVEKAILKALQDR